MEKQVYGFYHKDGTFEVESSYSDEAVTIWQLTDEFVSFATKTFGWDVRHKIVEHLAEQLDNEA
jgi:hypothetical protein